MHTDELKVIFVSLRHPLPAHQRLYSNAKVFLWSGHLDGCYIKMEARNCCLMLRSLPRNG
jgi:hypothetical protein